MEELMLDLMFRIPTTPEVKEAVITEEVVNNQVQPMLLYQQQAGMNDREIKDVQLHRQRSEKVLPAVPLRDMVVFPHMMAPFIVGRESSVRALELALSQPDKRLFLITQRDPKIDDPQRSDIQDIGVVARVIQNLKLPNGNVKVMVEGEQRAQAL